MEARSGQPTTFIDRMIGAAMLREEVYEEVEHDTEATPQAALVVILGALAGGIGAISIGIGWIVFGIVTGLIGWAVYAFLAHWIGTTWFAKEGTQADWGQLLRTLGFANSPAILLFIGILPFVGLLISLIVFVWILVTTVVAIRHALDFDTGSAILTAVVSWVAMLVIRFVLSAVFFFTF